MRGLEGGKTIYQVFAANITGRYLSKRSLIFQISCTFVMHFPHDYSRLQRIAFYAE